jgi:glucose/arabinose dehydrogenase/PKD repeat protein
MPNPIRMVCKWTRRFVDHVESGTPARGDRAAPDTQLIFETLEPRLLLSADPVGLAAAHGFEAIAGVADKRNSDMVANAAAFGDSQVGPVMIAAAADTTAPVVTLTPPASIVARTITLAATASDNVGVVGVRFLLDGSTPIGAEDTASPFRASWDTTTATNGTHTLVAQARDAAGNVTTSAPITVTVDNQGPTGTIVIDGGAEVTNSRNVTLTLGATDAFSSVTQMRFSNNGTSFSAAQPFATAAAWTLANGSGTMTVHVQFRDSMGNWSTPVSDTIVLDRTLPTISGRTVSGITVSSAQINWTTNEPSTSRVEYGLTSSYGLSTALDSSLVTAHSVALTGLAPNTTYNYRIRTIDAAGNERISGNATFRTAVDNVAPSVPSGLTATVVSTTQIDLSWNPSTDNVAVTGYRIFRDGTQVGTSTTTSFSDTGLSPGTPHVYAVRAVDAATNVSGPSGSATATTFSLDTTPPAVTVTAPSESAALLGTVTISADASDNVGVVGVTFLVNNVVVGAGEDATSPYGVTWDTTTVSDGTYTIVARARDAAGNVTDSPGVTVTVANQQAAGLVAAYSFDQGAGSAATDSSGHGNTANLANGVAWVPGVHGDAVSFDGVNDYITIPNSASTDISGNALTLSMWINPRALTSGDSVVLGKFWNTTMTSPFYQYGLELGGGNRTDFFVGTPEGPRIAFGGTILPFDEWTHLAITFDGAQVRTYVNGNLVNTQALSATITARGNPMHIGADASVAQFHRGMLDDLRIYDRVLTPAQIQHDMATPVGGTAAGSPDVVVNAPADGSEVIGIVNVMAEATDDTGVASVQFYVDGIATGLPDTTGPYALAWDSRTVSNGEHVLTARVTDLDGNSTLSAPVTVTVANTSAFQNEILATGFTLPTALTFLPDGRMLVVELAGRILVVPPPYTTPDPTPFLQLTNVGSAGVQQGVYDIALDPDFETNHYIYLFYTLATPNVDRFSRFTVNEDHTGVVPGSEFVIYQDTIGANPEHHGGSINFANDGTILITTGDHFDAATSQDLTSPRGKVLRFNMDGTVPTDNPFHDGAGPNYDAIWALGLRNPFRAYYDTPTGRLFIGDVGGNDAHTAIEEINIGARGANFGWPDIEGPDGNPAFTAPAYFYHHEGRDASVVAGFVYHGTQFPSSYQGAFFFADYTQNWIRYLTFDASGNVNGVFNFEPMDGSLDGPYGDIVYLTEGPDGALYYLDLGYSDIGGTFGVSSVRRIQFTDSNLAPVAAAAASPTQGPTPLTVDFSSAGSSDPEGQALSYLWDFGDGTTSTLANPSHTYSVAGPYQVRLTVSDGVNQTLAAPLAISAGNRPTVSITSPSDGVLFRAGDVISYGGTATDIEDGVLPASAYSWSIDFLHEGHVHPGIPIVGQTGGSFTIPTSGHDFHGFTRYRITLTVTDSDGLQSSQSIFVFPDKVDLTFAATPPGVTLYIDGIAHTAPFTYDTLIGFHHTIEARDTTVGTTAYTFASWSDGGAQTHEITVPAGGATYTATYTASSAPGFVQVNAATPQTDQSQVSVAYTQAQTAGNTNILAIGWNNATSNITSVTDSAGNVYQLAVPTARGAGLSQAIYYAGNIASAAAGTNTVTVTFDAPTTFVDIRVLEYSGLDHVDPFDTGASASGIGTSADSGAVTTTAPRQLVIGAGMTTGAFSTAGPGFTTRIITSPDADIAQDRFVTTAGTYNATASLSGTAAWLMQVATFKAAT